MPRHHPIEQQVAARIAELREKQGLTQADLGRRAGISRSMIAAIERREKVPTVTTLASIARGLGVRVVDLVAEEEPQALPDRALRLAAALREADPRLLEVVERLVRTVEALRR